MSTPTLREDEIAIPARPHGWVVTTARKMPEQRYHYQAGALMVWRSTAVGRTPVRMVVHTLCRNWISLPVLFDGNVDGPICDLCMLHQSRVWESQRTSGQVDF